MDADSKKRISAAVVNGYANGASTREDPVYYMKSNLGEEVKFVQDDNSESLSKGLSGKSSSKDDILIIDSQDRVIYYFGARYSYLGTDSSYVLQKVKEVSAPDFVNPCGTLPVEAPVQCQMENKRPKGKKVKMPKAKTACECHKMCKDENSVGNVSMHINKTRRFAQYYFVAPKQSKKNQNRKKPKLGPCSCIYAPKNPKRKIRFAKAKNERYFTGTVA